MSSLWLVVPVLAHLTGMVLAIRAARAARSPQGAVAWVMSLVLVPYLALPAYAVLRPAGFQRDAADFRLIRREVDTRMPDEALAACRNTSSLGVDRILLETLADVPVTDGNAVTLLIDGDQCYGAILELLEKAEHYVLLTFYIMRDDGVGGRLKRAMKAAAGRGVTVCLVYDAFGERLKDGYRQELEAAGVLVRRFDPGSRWLFLFRLNFRTHRKIVLADGKCSFIGGPNVGDEYRGEVANDMGWRDTGLLICGPSCLVVQRTFLEIWCMAGGDPSDAAFSWTVTRSSAQTTAPVLVSAVGPADILPACTLMLSHLFGLSRQRLWVTTPYFVPNDSIVTALKCAALRGVDVRVLINSEADSLAAYYASFAYLEELLDAGVGIYFYQGGFLHQKVILIDDQIAGIGSVNLDYRSLHLNFEMTALVFDTAFANSVGDMLERDLSQSTSYDDAEHAARGWRKRVFAPVAQLFAPIL